MKLIELNLQRIIDLCRKLRVKTLAVFGSILTDRFNGDSDVDFLVDFDIPFRGIIGPDPEYGGAAIRPGCRPSVISCVQEICGG